MCALYVRCALSVLQKECRKVWCARYTLGARYRSENMVIRLIQHQQDHTGVRLSNAAYTDPSPYRQFFVTAPILGLNQ
jgi:hypothetical protein